MAGGGIRGGAVFGASDRIAAYPSVNPVTPGDFAATMYHSLGIAPDTELHDRQNIPKQLYQGQPILPLFG